MLWRNDIVRYDIMSLCILYIFVFEYMLANKVFSCTFYISLGIAEMLQIVHVLSSTLFVSFVYICRPTLKVQGPVGSDRGRYCIMMYAFFISEFLSSCLHFSPNFWIEMQLFFLSQSSPARRMGMTRKLNRKVRNYYFCNISLNLLKRYFIDAK